MRDLIRWVVVIVAALVLIGLIAYARGDEHHRGDDVGALGTGVSPAAGDALVRALVDARSSERRTA